MGSFLERKFYIFGQWWEKRLTFKWNTCLGGRWITWELNDRKTDDSLKNEKIHLCSLPLCALYIEWNTHAHIGNKTRHQFVCIGILCRNSNSLGCSYVAENDWKVRKNRPQGKTLTKLCYLIAHGIRGYELLLPKKGNICILSAGLKGDHVSFILITVVFCSVMYLLLVNIQMGVMFLY